MTFSSKTKNELSRLEINKKCCAKAELAALLRTTGYISLKGFNRVEVEFTMENAAVIRRIFKMLKYLYNTNNEISVKKSNRLKRHNCYSVKIDEENVIQFLQDTRLIAGDKINILDFKFGIPKDLIKRNCCKRAYIRGAFMGCGSVNDPEKSYHLEFVSNKDEHSRDLEELLNSYDLNSKKILRKEYHVTYLKDSEKIVDLLNIMGAHNSLLDFENVRAIKETRNNVNRVVNCETANLEKIVEASVRQINSIKVLQKYNQIDKLPFNLKELAYLRLENDDSSLKELGEMLDPPLGKSGVNHRLKKIEKIAEEFLLRDERGEIDEIAESYN